MRNLYIVANWKSYKTEDEAHNWLQTVNAFRNELTTSKKVIVCPPFTLLSSMNAYIGKKRLSIELGAQDISPFPAGAYTGEVEGQEIKEFCSYVIVGHSERRKLFNETDEVVHKKLIQAINNDIVPILCVSEVEHINLQKRIMDSTGEKVDLGKIIVAYEPLFAIGSGKPDTPENANSVIESIKAQGVESVLYGGSVNPENVASFTNMTAIDGVLVGGASLVAEKYLELVKNA